MLATRGEVRAKEDAEEKTRDVPVPEWGTMRIKRMSVVQQERYWEILGDQKKGVDSPTGVRGCLVYMCCINEDGSDFWLPEDAEWLGTSANTGRVQLLYDEICDLSGVSDKALADIEKKPKTQSNSSSDGSASKSVNESTSTSSNAT